MQLRKIILFALLLICSSMLVGCASQLSEFTCLPDLKLHKHMEENFKDLSMPSLEEIKTKGIKKSYSYVDFDKVWDSVSIVLMQNGVIFRASKEKGIIALTSSPPSVFLIEEGNDIEVYLYIMESLYDRLDGEEKFSLKDEKCKDEQGQDVDCQERMVKFFFDKISVQAYTQEKWKYLTY